MAAQTTWKPYESLTQAPTNLKEAIDWVLRVTGKDGKKNDPVAAAKQSPQSSTSNGPHCLCYLAKAIKDLLYDAKDPGFPGPHPDRYWDDILVPEERAIVQPVLQDLGLLSTESTSATSTNSTCAGGTEVIKALIDHLAQGLQKWVGWQDGEECCLKGGSGESTGIGRKCDCNGSVGAGCCNGGKTCHECTECGKDGTAKCYLSAYCKKKGAASGGASTEGQYYWPTLSSDSTKVHLLARIFLGSVCLIWSGLSQLGFLTGGNGGKERWSDSSLHKIEPTGNDVGLGSFMAAMGYDLDRLNGSGGGKGNGEFVQQLLSGQAPDKNKGIQWKEFTGDSAKKGSVAEYYSSIYSAAQGAAKGKTTESICKDYPLLVLHILASGYFRAGSAGAKGVTTPPKAAEKKEETPSSRKPRTIREILYWLSALPYSQGYKELVTRMGDKTDQVTNGSTEKGKIQLYNEKSVGTTLLQKDITHYLMAASGYCPLVLIGIQGTINTSGTDSDTAAQGGGGGGSGSSSSSTTTDKKKCPNHKEDRNKRCNLDEIKKRKEEEAKAKAAQGQQQQQQQQNNNELQAGQVCYGGYHLEVKDFGPLHGMYANGLFGFDMGGSPAQCLDQLRTYVYHCFYQLYFLRKQCSTGAIAAVGGGGGSSVVLGWQSCRYGSGVNGNTTTKWICKGDGGAGAQHTQKCGLQDSAKSGEGSALQSFLCDALGSMRCRETIGVDLNSQKQKYPEIEEHMNKIVTPSGEEKGPHKKYPELCPVPMGWSKGSGTTGENHFKDLTQGTHKTASLQPSGTNNKYPAHCTGNTLSHLLQYYCDPDKCPSGTLVILLRLLACITPTVPRTLGDLFGFYYYIVYIGGQSGGGQQGVHQKLKGFENDVRLGMIGIGGGTDVVSALGDWSKDDQCKAGTQNGTLKCLVDCTNGTGSQYLCPLSGQQYGQLSHLMAGTYLSWLVYLIGEFETGVSQPWYCLLHYPFQVMTEQDQQLSLRAQNSQ